MKNKKKFALAFCMLASASALTATAFAVSAQTIATEERFVLKDQYVCGETLSTEGATVLVDGKAVLAEAILYRPDGVAVTGASFRLDRVGEYTLELFADRAGVRTSVRETFLVGEDICTFSEEGGSYALTAAGLNVTLNEGNRLTVNQTVDITGITAEEEIVTIAVTPSVAGIADFTKITVTATDAENPDCYVKMLLQASPTNPAASYGLAGGTNQALTGYEKEWDRIHKNNEWGTYMPFTFYGTDGATAEFGLRYDSATKKVYALEGREIIDLDERRYFPNSFAGFESGKIRISVECSSYQKDKANFIVKKLRGAPVTKTFISDETAPVLTVDKQDAYAVVGQSFPLFPASAKDDVSGAVKVTARVYRNYGMTNSYPVDSLGGAFTPTESGVYTIEYVAKDASGNCAIETADVRALPAAEELVLSLGEGTTEGTLGLPSEVRDCEVSGGSGKAVVTAVAVKDGMETSIEDGVWIPESAGEYEIVYTATDYIGNTATVKYSFLASAGEEPLFGEDPFLPRYFIAGERYTFEAVSVRDYTSGSRRDGESEIYLSQNNGSRKISPNTPVVMDFAEGNLTVIYRYQEKELRKNVPVVSVKEDGLLNLGKYFRGEKIEISVGSAGTAIGAEQGSRAEFIRELLAEGLTARFDVGKGGIGTLRVVLTDYVNPAEKVSLTLTNRDNGYAMLINGTELCAGKDIGFTKDSMSNEFSLRYESGSISCDGVNSYPIADADPSFRGFSSGRVYLEFYFDAAENGTLTVKNVNRQPVNTANSDRIPPRIVVSGDYGGEKQIGDEIVLEGADALDVLDTQLIFTLTVTDPDGNVVIDLDGNSLEGADGRGAYRFRIEQYGSYKVSYVAKDGTGFQDGVFNYVIPVEDKTAPEIAFAGEARAEYKKGETILLPEFRVSDNLSATENITVYRYVTTSSGSNVLLSEESGAVVAMETGVYAYFVVCYDEAGNMGLAKVTFTVTE